jgi:2-oxoisovalerate dehydrogenase E1 component
LSEPIDDFFVGRAESLRPVGDAPAPGSDDVDPAVLLALFDAQAQSRHLDLAARWLQSKGRGYYTIASAGHEANAALGMATRVDDPALLHYRSGGFYAARAAKHVTDTRATARGRAVDPIRDVLLGLVAAAAEPMSGGRHKVFGHPALNIIPQTSTIASHLPRAVGLAFSLGLPGDLERQGPWPDDAIVVCTFGDASVNHSTAQGALNAAAYLTHRSIAAPLLFVCEDNGIGISTPTPPGWVVRALGRFAEFEYIAADGSHPVRLLRHTLAAVDRVRETRRPGVLHLKTVRLMGHAGSDVESAYRSRAQIAADYERDPLLATAASLVDRGILDGPGVVARYESVREQVMAAAAVIIDAPTLDSREAVMRPLTYRRPTVPQPRSGGPGASSVVAPTASERSTVWAGKPPEKIGRLTLGHAINAALTDALITHPNATVFGQDVAAKGGVYGITRGLRKRFGPLRVFDAILDEQTILGTALGMALTGRLPIPEIQYLAYVHNAEDQLRGEAATLRFFSAGQYQNGMVVRIAGLGYQKGFGGHFHNDNSVAVLRDIPGIVVCVPSHPHEAPALVRTCVELAERDGRVCVFVEPIALYHARDLFREGDQLWTATYRPPWPTGVDPHAEPPTARPLGSVRTYGEGPDLLIVTFGNGVPMSLRAARTIAESAIASTVLDLTWLSPLPVDELLEVARAFDHVLVVDETRATGGVAESVLATLTDALWPGRAARVASADSFVPLGPAADHVLLGEDEIVSAARALLRLRPDDRV